VKDVLKQRTDENGVKRSAEISRVTADMLEQGAKFAFRPVDTSKYLLPQRRNRVFGVVSDQEQRPQTMSEDFNKVMRLLESLSRWPIEKLLFSKDCVINPTLTPRVQRLVSICLGESKGIRDADLFLDTSTSDGRKNKEFANGMTTCLRPTHKVYSATRQKKTIFGYICIAVHTYVQYIHLNFRFTILYIYIQYTCVF